MVGFLLGVRLPSLALFLSHSLPFRVGARFLILFLAAGCGDLTAMRAHVCIAYIQKGILTSFFRCVVDVLAVHLLCFVHVSSKLTTDMNTNFALLFFFYFSVLNRLHANPSREISAEARHGNHANNVYFGNQSV